MHARHAIDKPAAQHPPPAGWTHDSWRDRPHAHGVAYADATHLARVTERLSQLPPLVTSWEIERLKDQLAQVQRGERLVIQGGDCAETLADCRPRVITSTLKILLQMSLVVIHGSRRPVVRVGRFAGQYAKPRSAPTETREIDGTPCTLPSYFGDLVNHVDFDERAREPDPEMLLAGYHHAAMTLNFIRSLAGGGFADLHHADTWNLKFLTNAGLPEHLRGQYQQTVKEVQDAIRFAESIGEGHLGELGRVEFFASHEGLNLEYESAQTRTVPRREGHYCLTTHLPWIGERTRDIAGAHVEFFRGIRNPVGVKLGPKTAPEDATELIRTLNPSREPGKIVLITRMGATNLDALPALLAAVERSGQPVAWLCDPMHGNGERSPDGIKTRRFDAIVRELEATIDAHRRAGTHLGGVHVELTGDDVTEVVGGASGVTHETLSENYATACDPRLNYAQALELAFILARALGQNG
ncbi:MAG: 3-deoxy-7-phosphoheptulonate synthase class II [Planctomycetota bacterium]